MLLFATSNNGARRRGDPAGWTLVGDQPAGRRPDIRTRLYEKVATGADAGSQVTLTYAAVNKVDLAARRVLRASNTTTRSRRSRRRGETVLRGPTTRTPGATVANAGLLGAVVLGGQVVGDDDLDGPGRPDPAVAVGGYVERPGHLAAHRHQRRRADRSRASGLTATADSASAKATMWTVVLNVAP